MRFSRDKWRITDELLAQMSQNKARIRIHGEFYHVAEDQSDLVEGDIVLDRGDGCWGVIEMIVPSSLNTPNIVLQAAVRSDGCAECGVPLDRLVRLKKFNTN